MTDLSRTPTPTRMRRRRPVVSGLNWQPAEDVPGAVLPSDVQRRLTERLDALDAHTRRARFTFDREWTCR